jgi:hypothetical protein
MDLPIELYELIRDLLPFIGQIRLRQVSKYLYINLHVHDFYDIGFRLSKRLSDNILKNYSFIKKLSYIKISVLTAWTI